MATHIHVYMGKKTKDAFRLFKAGELGQTEKAGSAGAHGTKKEQGSLAQHHADKAAEHEAKLSRVMNKTNVHGTSTQRLSPTPAALATRSGKW